MLGILFFYIIFVFIN